MGRFWLMQKSPTKLAEEERARALREAARASRAQAQASEQGRLEVLAHARELNGHLKDALESAKGVDHVGQDVRAVGMEVQGLGRKVDSLNALVEEFIRRASAGAAGPGLREELREALEAVQSVNLVGQDVRTLAKEFDALRDWMIGLLEGDQQPAPCGRHRKTGDGEQAGAGVQDGQESAGTGAAPEETGLGPDEERYLW